MKAPISIGFVGDSPAEPPSFDFDVVADALTEVLRAPSSHAFVLGVHGPWGSGKTTLMRAISAALLRDNRSASPPLIVEFNAWKFQERDSLWRSLILSVVGELRREANTREVTNAVDELQQSLYISFAAKNRLVLGP